MYERIIQKLALMFPFSKNYGLLQRTIYKELILSFFLVLAILTLIFFVFSTTQFINRYGQFLSFIDFLVLIPYVMIKVITFTIPLAMLGATTLCYGRMSHDREILILRSAGIHAQEIFRPAFIMGIILSFISLYINHEIVPYAYTKQEELKYGAIEVILNANFSSQNSSIDFLPNLRISYRELKNGRFQGIIIQHITLNNKSANISSSEVTQEILAENATLVYDRSTKDLVFHLENCSLCNIQPSTIPGQPTQEQRFFFKKLTLPIPIDPELKPSAPSQTRVIKYKKYAQLLEGMEVWKKEVAQLDTKLQKSSHTMNANELQDIQKRHTKAYTIYCSYLIIWHTRTAISFAPWLVVFLGASLGLLVQHNNRLVAFAVSALPVIIVYYPLQMLGQFLADAFIVAPWVGGWLGTLTTGLVGIGLLLYAYRR